MAAGKKTLTAALTGYKGHPLIATLFTKPAPVVTSVINVIGGTPPTCGQVTIASKYVTNAVAFAKGKGWVGTAGSCASKGFSVAAGKKALTAAMTGYTKHPLTATLHAADVRPVTMATAYVTNAVAFAKGKGWVGTAGSCASKGYSVAAGAEALPAALTGYTGHPLTATLFAKPAAPAGGTTVINVIGGGKCGQVTMATKYVPNAVAFAKKQAWVGSGGPCASQGYTVAAGKKALTAALTGYTGHPLIATLYTTPTTPAATKELRFSGGDGESFRPQGLLGDVRVGDAVPLGRHAGVGLPEVDEPGAGGAGGLPRPAWAGRGRPRAVTVGLQGRRPLQPGAERAARDAELDGRRAQPRALRRRQHLRLAGRERRPDRRGRRDAGHRQHLRRALVRAGR